MNDKIRKMLTNIDYMLSKKTIKKLCFDYFTKNKEGFFSTVEYLSELFP